MELRDIKTEGGKKLKRKDALVEMLYQKAITQRDMVAFKELREMLSHAGAEIDGPQTTEAQIWLGVFTLIRKATDDDPELKKKFLDAAQKLRDQTD
jgi:hypothetical protein